MVMHLFRAALAACHRQSQEGEEGGSAGPPPRPRLIYFEQAAEFPEVKQLVTDTAQRYALDLRTYANVGFAQGLRACIEAEGRGAMAFLLGTRKVRRRPIVRWEMGKKVGLWGGSIHDRLVITSLLLILHPLLPPPAQTRTVKGDPNCKEQETFAPSSTWMPPFMRVNPILDWHYGHIWHFLRRYELPYCSLYEAGYTSLGKVDDTLPNPALARPDGSGEYYPAYMLQDWTQERAGRIDKKKLQQEQQQEQLQRKDESEAADCELQDFEEMRRKVGLMSVSVQVVCLSLSLFSWLLVPCLAPVFRPIALPSLSLSHSQCLSLAHACRRSTPRRRASSSSGTRS